MLCCCRVLVRRCSKQADSVPAASLRPLCSVLKAAAAWQQTRAVEECLVHEGIEGREHLVPISLGGLDRAARHQVPLASDAFGVSCRHWLAASRGAAIQGSYCLPTCDRP
jgi:hypothetical protein